MVTPIMTTRLGWGTYLFFACINACFFPCIYYFYPETAGRSLEEIDLIFAKGYLENISYVKAAQQMPFLSDEEIEHKAIEYGFVDADDEYVREKLEEGRSSGEKGLGEETEEQGVTGGALGR